MIIVLGEGFKKISRSEEYAGVGVKVKTGAAASLSVFTDWTAEQGLSGIEFAAGIPGSVGGAVAGNAGAWGTEISDVINRVYLADEKEIKIVQRKDLTFNYRCWKDLADSLNGFVITEVELTLANSSTSVVRKTMRELRISRQAKQPVGMPNAGSFFKNPENESAGRLIEGAGLKGVRVGGAEVSEKHANFLVNRGNATAADVIALMKEIQHRVEQKSGILLEPEVHFL